MADKRVVGVVLAYAGGFYLCQRMRGSHYSGLWSDCGGKVELFEPCIEACVREIKEETGLVIDQSRLVFDKTFTTLDNYELSAFTLELASGEHPQRTEPSKHSPWQWFTILPKPCLPSLENYSIFNS